MKLLTLIFAVLLTYKHN